MNLKMKKRRVRDFLLAGSLILGMMLTGCGMSGQQTEQNGGKEQNKVENEKISVVATIFPQYDFVRQIAGENVELKMLLKPGEETHSYEPTPQDIIAIQNSDLFIYVGGENDAWVEDILESMPDNGRKTLKLVDCVDTVEEEHVEGKKSVVMIMTRMMRSMKSTKWSMKRMKQIMKSMDRKKHILYMKLMNMCGHLR